MGLSGGLVALAAHRRGIGGIVLDGAVVCAPRAPDIPVENTICIPMR